MSAPAGLSAQLTVAQETTYGTYATPTRALDMVSENIKATRARLESKGLRAGRRVITSSGWASGLRTVAGTVKAEISQVNQGLLLLHCLGGTAATVNNADLSYTHTLTPGDLTTLGLTMQVGRPGVTGTVQAFSYLGGKVNKWTIQCKAGEIAEIDLDMVFQDESTAQALVNASAMYPATMVPLTFVGGKLVNAAAQVDVHDVVLVGDNKLDIGRSFLRAAATVKEPLEASWRDYTGTFLADFTDLTQYTQYVNGTETALVLTFQGAQIAGVHFYSIVITMNVRFDGDTPVVPGPALLTQPVSFKAIASGAADSSAISIAYTTTDVLP